MDKIATPTDDATLAPLSISGGPAAEFGHPDAEYTALYLFHEQGAEQAQSLWGLDAAAAVLFHSGGRHAAEIFTHTTSAALRFADAYREANPDG